MMLLASKILTISPHIIYCPLLSILVIACSSEEFFLKTSKYNAVFALRKGGKRVEATASEESHLLLLNCPLQIGTFKRRSLFPIEYRSEFLEGSAVISIYKNHFAE